jgi:hypothetical protein
MRHEDLDVLDRDVHDALRALPTPRAPHTLLPRVMVAVHARLAAQAVATTRTWFEWSVWAQLASVVGFVVMVAAGAMIWPSVEAGVSRMMSVDVIRVGSHLYTSVWQPLVLWFVVGVTMTFLFCATVGALLTRVALGGASR